MMSVARGARSAASAAGAARRGMSNAVAKVESEAAKGSAVTAPKEASSKIAASTYSPRAAEPAKPSAFFGGRIFAFLAGFGVGTLCFAMPSFAGTKLLHTQVTKNVKNIGADIEASNTELRQRVARLEQHLSAIEARRA
uniref:Uncharacterized protein n=2 Tax=Cafeteria roenbergensis TaxID=33653 RepID=A0A7S0PGQ3_CAFRO